MRVLVTAGPTREALDPVRFISNRSTGKMGYAVARAARRRGHEVMLISGPVALPPPAGVDVTDVTSAAELAAAVADCVPWCDALVMAAAVADWRPATVSARKLKKHGYGRAMTLELVRTEDVLQSVRDAKGDRLFVGFAAETEQLVTHAREKLVAKGLDAIVANDVTHPDAGFAVDTNTVALVLPDGTAEPWPNATKDAVAERLVAWMEAQR